MPMSRRAMPRASRLSAALAVAFVSLACVPAAFAQVAPAADPRTLDAIVVTAEAPVSPLTYVTDPRLPRQPVPASDGADYLKTIPGFTALRNGGTNGDPVLRGMFGSRLNLLTNDGAMPGACPARMDNPMSYVAPETYDRVVVVKGPQTVLWGPGASAGTVRFERETPVFDAPGARLHASALAGSFDRNDEVADATVGAAAGYARVVANRSRSSDYEDGDGDVVPSAWKKWNADAALGWTPAPDTVLELSAGTGNGQARYAGRGMDGAQFRRDSLGLRFDKTSIGGALDAIHANAFYNHADHVMDNYTLRDPNPMGAMPMPMASNVDRRTTGGRVALDWRWTRWQLATGLDTQRSRHRERNAMGRHTYAALPWTPDAVLRNTGLFAETTFTPRTGTRWIAGARVDRASARDQRATTGMMDMDMPNPTAGRTRRETLASGFARFEHDLAGTPMTWYAGLGHSERMPDYWELISPDMGPTDAPDAFAGVQPEKTTQLDVGLQVRTTRASVWVSAYAGRVDDFILFTYTAGGMMGQATMASNVDARIHGGEAGVEFRPAKAWKLGATAAYAWGENRSDNTPLPQMPPLDVRLSGNYDTGRWSVGALWRIVAAQHRVAVGQGNVVGRDLGPTAGFGTFAVNGGYRFGERLQLTAGVDNIFDRTYAEHLNLSGSADFGYPADPVRIHEPGRSVWVKLDYAY